MEMLRKMLKYLNNEEGQDIIEYVLVIVLISLVLIFAFFTADLKDSISNAAVAIADAIQNGVDSLP